jgi:antibiotic biosynthesis monooxygenase (ABM) superfamily enzyme
MILENEVPGYLATTIIASGGNTSSVRYIINRFSDKASMDAWESSGEALMLIGEADNCSTRHYASATGLEAWFSVPDFKAVVARGGKWPWSYSLQDILLARCHIFSFNPFLAPWPLLTNTVIYSGILVVSLIYLMMPAFRKLLRRWFYPAKRYSH